MTTGQTVDLIVTLFVGGLMSIISVLLKGRFDSQDKTLESMANDMKDLQDTATSNSEAIIKLTESQKYVAQNQTLLSRSQESLVSGASDLEDVNDQLQDATRSLYMRMEAHDKFHQELAKNKTDRERGT